MKCRLTPRATSDLEGIGDYLADRSPRAALAMMDVFAGRWSQLAHHPHSGPPRDDLGTGIRCLVIGQYLAFYRIAPDEVTILRVLHGKREIGAEEFG